MGWRREGEDQRQGAGKGDRIQAPGDRRLGVAPHCPPNINTLRFPCSDGPDNHPLSTGTIWRQGGRCGPYFISIKHKFTHLLARWKKKEKKPLTPLFPTSLYLTADSHKTFTHVIKHVTPSSESTLRTCSRSQQWYLSSLSVSSLIDTPIPVEIRGQPLWLSSHPGNRDTPNPIIILLSQSAQEYTDLLQGEHRHTHPATLTDFNENNRPTWTPGDIIL